MATGETAEAQVRGDGWCMNEREWLVYEALSARTSLSSSSALVVANSRLRS